MRAGFRLPLKAAADSQGLTRLGSACAHMRLHNVGLLLLLHVTP